MPSRLSLGACILSLLFFAAIVGGAEEIRLRNARPKAQTDALIAELRSGDSARQLAALSQGEGILRRDFRDAVALLLDHPDPAVKEAARKLIVSCRIEAGYGIAVREAARGAGRRDSDSSDDVFEGEDEILSPSLRLPPDIVRSPAAANVLHELLTTAKTREARYDLVTFVAQTRQPSAVPTLIALMKDADRLIALRAARGLGVIGTKSALDALAGLARAEPPLARQAAIGLGANGDERALAIWQRLLRDHPREGYGADRWVASREQMETLIPLFLPLLEHSDGLVGSSANWSLARITEHNWWAGAQEWKEWLKTEGQRERYERALDLIPDERHWISDEPLRRLVAIGDRRAIPALVSKTEKEGRLSRTSVDAQLSAMSLLAGRAFSNVDEVKAYLATVGKDIPHVSPLVAPFQPLEQVGRAIIDGGAEHLTIAGRSLFVGMNNSVEMYDLPDPLRPELIGRWDIAAGVAQLHGSADRLYVSHRNGGLLVYRYTPGGDMEFVERQGDEYSQHFMLQGDHLLLNGRSPYLYDTRGEKMQLLDSAGDADIAAYRMADSHSFFCNADLSGGKISFQGRCRVFEAWGARHATAVESGGRLFYVSKGMLNIRDAASGTLLGQAPARSPGERRLLVREGRAYMLLDNHRVERPLVGGVRQMSQMSVIIYDVADPADIKLISHTPLPRGLWRGLAVEGGLLYTCNDWGQLLIYEASPTPSSAEQAAGAFGQLASAIPYLCLAVVCLPGLFILVRLLRKKPVPACCGVVKGVA